MATSTEDKVKARMEELEVARQAEANRGVEPTRPIEEVGRNPSGTFSEPTPTDVRYPNKLETEFENNMGAHVGKSAAQLRETLGLPDQAGGLKPEDAPDHVKAAVEAGKMPAHADEPPDDAKKDAKKPAPKAAETTRHTPAPPGPVPTRT